MSNPIALVQKLWNYCNMGSLAPARSGLRPFARFAAAQVCKRRNYVESIGPGSKTVELLFDPAG